MFLVGGFGESSYLKQQIEYNLSLWKVHTRVPDTSWTAVVRGAVVCGIEKSTSHNLLKATSCPHYYGIAANQLFSADQHPEEDRIVNNANDLHYAEDQMMWLLRKGDLILGGRPRDVEQSFTLLFAKVGSRKGRVTVYRYSDDDPPEGLKAGKNGEQNKIVFW